MIHFKELYDRYIADVELSRLPPVRRILVRIFQVLAVALKKMQQDNCLFMASSLTYWTMLAVVPLLALAFSILKGFGVQNRLEPFIIQRVAVGFQDVVAQIIQYVNNTNVGSLGTIGLLGLIVSVITMIGIIERSLNIIWKVKKDRTLYRKFTDYLSVILVGPLFLLAAISITTTLESNIIFHNVFKLVDTPILGYLRFGPYLIMWCAFTLIYLFIPNTRVRFLPALIGGILGGTLWQLLQEGYIYFQVLVTKYNAIYGAMAQLPILLIWFYWSWIIVLFGAEVAAGFQNNSSLQEEELTLRASFASRELSAISIMAVIASNFSQERKPWSLSHLADYLNLPLPLAEGLVFGLIDAGLLEQGPGDDPVCLLARSLEKITIRNIIDNIRFSGVDINSAVKNDTIGRVDQYLNTLYASHAAALGRVNLKEVVQQLSDEVLEV